MAYYQAGNMQGYPPQQNCMIGTRRQATCPVCMSHTIPPNIVLEPCQHQFHYQCIEVYTQNAKICPVCRVPIQRHLPLTRPATTMQEQQQQQQHQHHHQPDYTTQAPPGYSMSSSNQQQQPPHHLVHNNAIQSGPSAGAGHFASASVYELPPEVFLDNSYDQSSNTSMHSAKMRKGKWTSEEAAYCDRLIEEFKHGNLPLAEGTTLRTFLSKLLNCDPMRISKKYTGNQCIGKIIFRRKSKEPTKDEIETTRKQLAELERIYLDRERMNQQRREKRLESEVNRDRSRLLSNARSIVYTPPTQPTLLHQPPPHPGQPHPGYIANHLHGGMTHPHSHAPYQPPQQPYHQSQFQPPPSYAHQHHQPPPSSDVSAQPQQSQRSTQHTKSPPATSKEAENTHSNISTIKAEGTASALSLGGGAAATSAGTVLTSTMKRDHSLAMMHSDKDLPRISSVDSFSSLFPRIASLDCFQSLHPTTSATSHRLPHHHASPHHDSSSLYRSPSLECLNTIPRVGSLEQFSNFIANMPPEPTTKPPSSTVSATSNSTSNASNDQSNAGATSPPKPTSATHTSVGAPSTSKPPTSFPRIASLDRLNLPRGPSMDRLPRINSTDGFLHHVPSLGSLSAFGSFSNFSSLSNTKDKGTTSTGGHSSIEDILSLVAASEGGSDKKRKSPSYTNLASLADQHVDKKPAHGL
ncbi:hypothetical protein DYB32_004957 [Aphanomyces invadans]|uniref:RING-type domain-containing protein n=1 Tax=Aphanomyces invadans TaxID=157072 RepID=A0A418AW07_9STRA|nr:hypothetical protein DYB32_004957 [Aphanomyces invadans]